MTSTRARGVISSGNSIGDADMKNGAVAPDRSRTNAGRIDPPSVQSIARTRLAALSATADGRPDRAGAPRGRHAAGVPGTPDGRAAAASRAGTGPRHVW